MGEGTEGRLIQMDNAGRSSLRRILWRGVCKRCPRCGEGAQFRTWFTLHERCASCDLEFEPHPGDTWAFWVLGDRILLGIAIAMIYFGVRPIGLPGQLVFFLVVAGAIVLTMPRRQGVCTALDYFLRLKFGEDT